jgi:sortase A
MHYSTQYKKTRNPNRPAWILSFTSLVIIVYILISQRSAVRAYYETWMQQSPRQQVLQGISQKKLELEMEQGAAQATAQVTVLDSPNLLPSYTSQYLNTQAEIRPPISTPLPTSITQPAERIEARLPEQALIPDRLIIPAIKVDAAVTPVNPERVKVGNAWQSTWPVPPADEAGWHNTSATLGLPGNTVVNGHNYPQDAIFRSLYKLEPGDQITLHAKDRVFKYVVVEILILPEKGQSLEVRQANARYIQQTNDERLTLVTCHPYASLANRLIVIAVPDKALIGMMN